uniref:ER membrane protein complex subunit 2 n=1 Tax=Panagrolaimus davidi TaxID=227884 RepID=A0A914Q9E8_9BILA
MLEAIDWTGISFSEARETLKKWREEHARQSEESVEIWEHVIYFYSFRKRKVAILIAKGDRLEAIRELNSYLEIFLNDREAWQQLCELYLKEGDYARTISNKN